MDRHEIPQGSIVVGVDGSDSCAGAVVWAARQARLEHRNIVLVHAVDMRSHLWVSDTGVGRNEVLDSLRAEGEAILATACTTLQEHDDGLDVHAVVRFGDPREILLGLSKEAAIVVLGSRGRGPISSLLLGSVGVTVARHSHCPVVVMRPHGPDTDDRIVVGVTGCDRAGAAIEFAYRLASLRTAPLLVVHCLESADHGSGAISLQGNEDDRILVAETLAGMAEKFPDVEVRIEMRSGPLGVCLVEASRAGALVVVAAESEHADGAMPHRDLSRWVTEHARCAVAVVSEG